MLFHKYVKSRKLSLDVENHVEYIIRCDFGGCVMICFKVMEENLPRFPAVLGIQKREKEHGHIRIKFLFIKCDNTFCRVLLTTTKCNCVLSL